MMRVESPAAGVSLLTLDRPAQRNALCCELIDELRRQLRAAANSEAVRVVLLAGAGESFCAGGDRGELKRVAEGDAVLNSRQAESLAGLLLELFEFAKPLITLVHGPAIGAGAGLAAASDIALAAPDARFALPEARMGLVSAVVSPYLVHAVGERQVRRWLLTGESFSASEAARCGLVSECVPARELRPRALALAADIIAGDPQTLVATKRMLRHVAGRTPDAALAAESATELVRLRASGAWRERLTGGTHL